MLWKMYIQPNQLPLCNSMCLSGLSRDIMCGIIAMYIHRIVTYLFVNNVFVPQCGGYTSLYMQPMVMLGHSVALLTHGAMQHEPKNCAKYGFYVTMWPKNHKLFEKKVVYMPPPLAPPVRRINFPISNQT